MEVNSLLKDELEFELNIRGVYLKSTVAVMRKVLTELLHSEQSDVASVELKAPRTSVENPEVELVICETKLKNLASHINELSGKPEKAIFRRIYSRLCHLQGRVNLLTPVIDADVQRKTYYTRESCGTVETAGRQG